MAASPSANRWPSVGEQLVAGAGRRRAPRRPRPAGVVARRPSERARASTCRAAGELLEAAGVAAAYVADQRGAGQRQEADLAGAAGGAAVEPAVDHDRGAQALVRPEQHEVVDAPRRARTRSSATAARLTSLSTSTGTPSASASRSSRCGSCQPGRWRA